MEKNQTENRESFIQLVKKAIELLADKNISQTVILSSYKINSVLRENFGVNLRIDKIGRMLSKIAKLNDLKRLNTNIPKYKLKVSRASSLQFF